MRKVLDKSCRENQNTHVMLDNFFFFSENHAVYGTWFIYCNWVSSRWRWLV